MSTEEWAVSHKGGAAWWADRGNTALGPFENRDVAAMVVNNLNDVLHLDHKKAAEYWIDRACNAEDKLAALEARARWAEDVARPALEMIDDDPASTFAAKDALDAYPQPEQEAAGVQLGANGGTSHQAHPID